MSEEQLNNNLEDLSVQEMINICRGRVPDELLEGAEDMEAEELLGFLLGELPEHGISEPEALLLESRLVMKVPSRLETLFDSLHDNGANLNISAAEFSHLEGITAPFVQADGLAEVAEEAELTPEQAEEWRKDIEAGKQKLLLAKLDGRIAGRINIFRDPDNPDLPEEEKTTPLLDDLWIAPDFQGRRIEDYLILAAENYILTTHFLPDGSSINPHAENPVLLAAAEKLGYRTYRTNLGDLIFKDLERNT